MKPPRMSDEVLEWTDDEPPLDLVQVLERITYAESLNPTNEEDDPNEYQ